MIVSCFMVRKQAWVGIGFSLKGHGLDHRTRPCQGQAKATAPPPSGLLDSCALLTWIVRWGTGARKSALASEVSSQDKRSGPKWLELGSTQPAAELGLGCTLLPGACPSSLGQLLRERRTDKASAPGNL